MTKKQFTRGFSFYYYKRSKLSLILFIKTVSKLSIKEAKDLIESDIKTDLSKGISINTNKLYSFIPEKAVKEIRKFNLYTYDRENPLKYPSLHDICGNP